MPEVLSCVGINYWTSSMDSHATWNSIPESRVHSEMRPVITKERCLVIHWGLVSAYLHNGTEMSRQCWIFFDLWILFQLHWRMRQRRLRPGCPRRRLSLFSSQLSPRFQLAQSRRRFSGIRSRHHVCRPCWRSAQNCREWCWFAAPGSLVSATDSELNLTHDLTPSGWQCNRSPAPTSDIYDCGKAVYPHFPLQRVVTGYEE